MGQRHKHADVIIAWAEGKDVQIWLESPGAWGDVTSESPAWLEDCEYRIKPPSKKYRVALFKYPGVKAVVSVANSEEDAERYEENPQFVRWLTGWTEYEELNCLTRF